MKGNIKGKWKVIVRMAEGGKHRNEKGKGKKTKQKKVRGDVERKML